MQTNLDERYARVGAGLAAIVLLAATIGVQFIEPASSRWAFTVGLWVGIAMAVAAVEAGRRKSRAQLATQSDLAKLDALEPLGDARPADPA